MKRLTYKRNDRYVINLPNALSEKDETLKWSISERENGLRLEGDIPNRLAAIEDILGDDYDLSRLRELAQADREGRCVVLPCGVGDSVFHITTCEGFSKVLDGTMYGANGEHGTATGYYCPCELTENCPFQLEEDGSFDCEKHKNTAAIYEDIATEIVVNDMESYVRLDYSGCVDFDEFGKTVFLTREAAEEALKGEKHG